MCVKWLTELEKEYPHLVQKALDVNAEDDFEPKYPYKLREREVLSNSHATTTTTSSTSTSGTGIDFSSIVSSAGPMSSSLSHDRTVEAISDAPASGKSKYKRPVELISV